MDITKLMREKADDLAEREKRRPDPANLASQINSYLNNELSASEMDKLSREHGEAIDSEIARREKSARHQTEQDEKNALRIFNGVYTDKEEADARRACAEFGQRHPILSIVKNQLTLLEEVANRKQFVTVANLEAAYKFLRSQGAFEEPIEPVQSAVEFKAANIQDWPTPDVPPLIVARIGKILDTFTQANPRYIRSDSNKNKIVSALDKSGMQITMQSLQEIYNDLVSRGELELSNAAQTGEVLTVTNLGGHAPGYPRQPQKPSFRKLVRELTADELKQRMLDDKKFEAALDNLK